MKKKGFTLIELLAVIVILAIIALIATPTILGVIEKARKGAAEASAFGYIDAIEKQIMINGISDNNQIVDGTYYVSELEISYKGKGPTQGEVIIESGKVKEAKICIEKYSLDYDGKLTFANNNYCSTDFEVTLYINETKESKRIGLEKTTTFELTDISNMTNMSCNNGAIPSIENNTLTITNIFGDTVCKINDSLEETIEDLDNTETYIVMLSDEVLNNTLTTNEENYIILDLNGKLISTSKIFIYNYGKMIVNDTRGSGKIISSVQALNNSGEKELIVNGGTFERNAGTGAVVYNQGNGTIVINNGNFISIGGGIQNNIKDGSTIGNIIINNGYFESKSTTVVSNNNSGQITLNGGTFISEDRSSILNLSIGTININQTNTPIYISSLAQTWKPSIINNSTGTINIKGNMANECTNDYSKTTSGLCVYAEGDKNYSTNTANTAVSNAGDGIININGGTYYGGYIGIQNHYDGTINIVNGNISSDYLTVVNSRTGNTNICNANVRTSNIDLWASSTTTTGIINYSSSVIFTDGTNTPVIGGITENIIPNYTGICSEEA